MWTTDLAYVLRRADVIGLETISCVRKPKSNWPIATHVSTRPHCLPQTLLPMSAPRVPTKLDPFIRSVWQVWEIQPSSALCKERGQLFYRCPNVKLGLNFPAPRRPHGHTECGV